MAIISLTSSGIKDFFVQRVTAVIIAVYFAYVLVSLYGMSHSGTLDYNSFRAFFIGSEAGSFMKIATLLVFVSMFLHAWVGIWIICSDYIKCSWGSATVMLTFILVYLVSFIYLAVALFSF